MSIAITQNETEEGKQNGKDFFLNRTSKSCITTLRGQERDKGPEEYSWRNKGQEFSKVTIVMKQQIQEVQTTVSMILKKKKMLRLL